MSLKPLLTFFLFAFLPATSLYTQQETDKKTDRIINKAMAEEEFSGMAVAAKTADKPATGLFC